MKVRYKKNTYDLTPGTKIQVNWRPVFTVGEQDNWVEATIESLLSAQFTCFVHVAGDPLAYHFYDAVGDTWRPKNVT